MDYILYISTLIKQICTNESSMMDPKFHASDEKLNRLRSMISDLEKIVVKIRNYQQHNRDQQDDIKFYLKRIRLTLDDQESVYQRLVFPMAIAMFYLTIVTILRFSFTISILGCIINFAIVYWIQSNYHRLNQMDELEDTLRQAIESVNLEQPNSDPDFASLADEIQRNINASKISIGIPEQI